MLRLLVSCMAVVVVVLIASMAVAAEEIDLLDGNSLANFSFVPSDGKTKIDDTWSLANGILHCTGKPVGYLRTDKEYSQFVLKLQWRWPKGSQPGNSGVLIGIQGPARVWPKSIEPQLQADRAGDIWNIGQFPLKVAENRTQGIHTRKMHRSNEKPVGEWNDYEVVVRGGKLTIKVNGLVQNEATGMQDVRGAIGLQSEGTPVEFRQMRLTPLD